MAVAGTYRIRRSLLRKKRKERAIVSSGKSFTGLRAMVGHPEATKTRGAYGGSKPCAEQSDAACVGRGGVYVLCVLLEDGAVH